MGGVYRRLLVRPSNFAGTVCYYDDPHKPLIQSDLDKLRNIDISSNILKGNFCCSQLCSSHPELSFVYIIVLFVFVIII